MSRSRGGVFGSSDVELLWSGICACTDLAQDSWRIVDHAGWKCAKPLDLVVARPNDEKSLGLVLRLIVIREFLNAPVSTFFASAKALSKEKDTNRTTKNLDRHFQMNSDKTARVDHLFFDGIREWINRERKKRSLNGLPLAVIFDDPVTGNDAPIRYRRMLREQWTFKQPLIDDKKFVFENDEVRTRFVARLKDALRVAKSTESKPILINVHARDLWAGLSACAAWIAHDHDGADDRPSLVIPLRRYRRTAAEVPGKSAVSAATSRPEILSFSEILGILKAFVDGGLEAVENAPEFEDEDGLFDIIHHIRLRLAARPVILIFDGHFEPERGDQPSERLVYGQLERHVNDDYLERLILRLLEPPFCSVGSPSRISRYAENRIVVTSNVPIDLAKRLVKASGIDGACQLTLVPPKQEDLSDVLDQQVLEHGNIVKALLLDSEKVKGCRTDIAWLLDAFVGVANALANSELSLKTIEAELPDRRRHNNDQAYYTQIVIRLLALASERRPAWRDLLYLVALTPDGLRPSSIRRFAERASQLSGDIQPLRALVEAFRERRLNPEFEALGNVAYAICGLVRSDPFEGVDSLAHPLELRLEEENAGRRAFDILYPELKAVVKAQAAEHLRPLEFHAIHRLLSEEALQQQTVSLRHVDRTNLPSIRPWRRMLSAFFHGLQSLPLELDEKGNSRIKTEDFGTRDLISFGAPPEFWRYLYAFCYRRMLERPPAWNLSRLYALDELKVELLSCFDRPWRIWPEQFSPRWVAPGNGIVACQGNDRVSHDWAISLAQAQIATGRLAEAKMTLNGHRTGHLDAMSALKRDIDIRILQCERVSFEEIQVQLVEFAGFSHEELQGIKEHVDIVAREFYHIVDTGKIGADEADISRPNKVIETLFARTSARSRASDVADIYFRLAEVFATRADLASVRLDDAVKGDIVPDLPILRADELLSARAVAIEFCRSLACYRFAEQLRLRVFSDDLTGSNFFASGHQIRQSIRVALKLELQTRKRAREQKSEGTMGLGMFARFARRSSDTLTRHLFRYPRERASQLIIEATMLRHLAPDEKRLEYLVVARSFLGSSERLIVGLGRTARVRIRLALERNKLNRTLGQIMMKSDRPVSELYFKQARYDVDYMATFAQEFKLPLWQVLAEIQSSRLRRVSSGLGV